ncbi:MAG TPA: ATP-binding protein [Bryobacteraceae bacterium]|nr:ATP-binding protein [Bryobacteraceae bacterium]
MSVFFQRLFSSDFLPYGQCYLWQPALVWLHAISDGLITLAYYSIPFTLIWFVRKRAPLRLGGVTIMFAGFVTACGTTHLMSLWNLWHSTYRLEGAIKAVTAVLSMMAAFATIKLAPAMLKLASPNELERINRWLREEVAARATAEGKLRLLLERERSTSEARVRSYFEAASQGIIVVEQDGRIVLVNRRTEEMFGYTRGELAGSQLDRLLPLGLALSHAGVRKDGTEFPVEIGLSFLETEEGRQALGLVSDVTEHQRAADQLAQANAELRRSNAELEQFAYVASHDLQEPLRMIISYMTLLQRRYCGRLNREADEFIHYAVDGASRMKRMIQDFLSVSRIGTQAIRIESVPALAIVQNALNNLKASIDESGAVVTVSELPAIEADAGLLAQVFQNLIGNAIKFRRDGPPHVNVSAVRVSGDWVFSVKDDGIGVEPQYADRIFRIFERLHDPQKYQGSGIGLAVSKKIVERHGGRMWLDSQRGDGAVFSFSIPFEQAVGLTEAVGA